MRDADWSRENLLRSDWLLPSVAPITTLEQETVRLKANDGCTKHDVILKTILNNKAIVSGRIL